MPSVTRSIRAGKQAAEINRSYSDIEGLRIYLNGMQFDYFKSESRFKDQETAKAKTDAVVKILTADEIVPIVKNAWRVDPQVTRTAIDGYVARLHQGNNENLGETLRVAASLKPPRQMRARAKEFLKRIDHALAELPHVTIAPERDTEAGIRSRILKSGVPIVATLYVPEFHESPSVEKFEATLAKHGLESRSAGLQIIYDGEVTARSFLVFGAHTDKYGWLDQAMWLRQATTSHMEVERDNRRARLKYRREERERGLKPPGSSEKAIPASNSSASKP